MNKNNLSKAKGYRPMKIDSYVVQNTHPGDVAMIPVGPLAGRWVLRTDHLAVISDLESKLTAVIAERDALQALQDEQVSIVLGMGAIKCRNGHTHKRAKGCLYCERDKFRAKLAAFKKSASKK